MIHPEKKHIVIVTSEFPPQPGGIGSHAYHLALFLFKNDYDIRVIADQRSQDNSRELLFDKSLPFQVLRIQLQRWRLFMYINRIFTTFKYVRKADFVIATGKFPLWNVALCTRFFRRSIMAIIHGTEVNFKSFWLRTTIDMALKQFNTIVAVSNYTKKLISHLKRNVVVIPNGIDLEKWNVSNNVVPKSLNGNPILTTVGRVSTRKGQSQVIKCLPELIKDYPELHYHCIGIPTESEDFILISKKLGVDSHVTFHGTVDHEELKQMLKLTDVFVMLSTESQSGDVEGFGIAILEANAMGIPSIGSKGCGIEDAINQGISGFLINKNDTNAFSSGIASILKEKTLFEKNTKSWAKSHDWNIIVKQYIDLIKCEG